jgi:hypothetical protein
MEDSLHMLLKSMDNRLGEMDKTLKTIVGDDKCTGYRTRCCDSNESKFSDLYNKYNDIHKGIIEIRDNQITSSQLPDIIHTELLKMSFGTAVGVVKSNRFSQFILALFMIDTVGIVSGRVFDFSFIFGTHYIMLFVVAMLLVILLFVVYLKGSHILKCF